MPELPARTELLSIARRIGWSRLLRWLAIGLGTAYLMGCWVILMAERRFTYEPAPQRLSPEASRLAGVAEREIATPDGERLIAWVVRAKPGRPTILYFHGNGGALGYRAGRVAAFQAEGYGVLMIAYRGYSGSTGRPTEEAIIRDARHAYDVLRGEGRLPAEIVIYGESLGTSVATQTAVAVPALALILEAPFTSMVDAWRQFVPHLPVGLLLRDRYDSRRVIHQLAMPLLILHGERDRTVGFALGRQLFEAAPEPKRFEAFPWAGHTNLYGHNAIAAVRRFIDDVQAGRLAARSP